ncbi:3-phenylpropionate/trans-cinnamate dioxygenase ferredoxin reductase subunit [Halobacillus karajensis]|uniref:NAD(P)/FAD-dependent oxidoreductase n=1 Tax=Halobacillus karajensis TaxID=195088 RepID=UPI0008A7BC0D|nr:FAD-dependent oxidoreductase [Halobacillus karajensis]SEI04037.1 3-phenylpropionate/trans-cinnamate dioxygenase ferredoxin reductase subunit [Halobacillus karajensis]
MLDHNRVVIVGSGIAGHSAARELRNQGYEGEILLIEGEAGVPYDRPPLSKEFLAGEKEEGQFTLYNPDDYDQLSIHLLSGVYADWISKEEKAIYLKDGSKIEYSSLIIATGSSLRKLSVEGDHLQGVHYLRALSDAKKLRGSLPNLNRIAIVGAGFIGLEVASVCREKGIEVTIIEKIKWPMSHIFGENVGQYFREMHEAKGVEFLTGDSLHTIQGEQEVEGVITAEGKQITCDAVLIGIGVVPTITFQHPELDVNKGIVVDDYGRTSIENVYAAGDCAEWPYLNNNVVVSHWDHAVQHGKSIAKNIVNNLSEPYRNIPYFWSNQYDRHIQFLGKPVKNCEIVVRGSLSNSSFSVYYLDKYQIVQAALLVNEPKHIIKARKMIQKQQPIERKELEDPKIPLKKVQMYQRVQ